MSFDLPEEVSRAMLEELRQRYQAGDKSKLVAAIRFCGNHKLIMPEWVVDAFFKATNSWYNYEVKELGEALDLAWPKGAHINALKKKRKNKYAVYNRVSEAHEHGETIDINLFEQIGRELGIGRTLASEYYYEVKAMMESMEKDFHEK